MKNSIISSGAGIVGIFLGIVIARVIGIADGWGLTIGMMAGVMLSMNFLIPNWEKRNTEESENN